MSIYAEGNEISDLTIAQATIEGVSSCLHYQIVGICFWLNCSSGTCQVDTTNRIEHLLPDAVVSVYRGNGMNPWQFANTIVDPLAYQLGQAQVKSLTSFDMGYGNENTNSPNDTDTHFKEVDVIGNPVISIFISHNKIFLPSQAQSYQPYYLSMQDALAWRSSLTEMFYPASFTPGMHEMGSFPLNNWGPIYPRTGFMNQPNDAKAAALAAQRATDIATRQTQPHVYLPLNSSCGDRDGQNNKEYYFYDANGNPIGRFGDLPDPKTGEPKDVNFDLNFNAVSDKFPPPAPGIYVATEDNLTFDDIAEYIL